MIEMFARHGGRNYWPVGGSDAPYGWEGRENRGVAADAQKNSVGVGGYALKNDGCRVSRRRRALDP
jgi:hypothetical protein